MIRKAVANDIPTIMSIVRSAQLALAELGIDQWQDGYPSVEAIDGDIERGVGYVVCDDEDMPIGYAAIVLTGEEAYKQIESWATNDEYVVVHRLCVSGSCRRRGISYQLMRHAAELARKQGFDAFRIDTHRGNIRMLQMMQKLGFAYRGIVHYDSGERLAFDLNLDLTNTI